MPAQLAQEALAAFQRGDYLEAERTFLAASNGFSQAGDLLMSAEMANNRSVALLKAGNAAGALEALEGSEAVFEKAGDRKRQALAIGNRAAALEGLSRLDEALQAYEACAQMLKELGEGEQRAHVLQAASAIYYRRKKPLEALAIMRSGVSGLPHPTLKQRLLKKLLDIPFSLIQGGK